MKRLTREQERQAILDFADYMYPNRDWPDGWLEGCKVTYRENPDSGEPEFQVSDADGRGDGSGEWFPV